MSGAFQVRDFRSSEVEILLNSKENSGWLKLGIDRVRGCGHNAGDAESEFPCGDVANVTKPETELL